MGADGVVENFEIGKHIVLCSSPGRVVLEVDQLFGHFRGLLDLFSYQPHGSDLKYTVVPRGCCSFFIFFCSIAYAPLLSSLRLFFLSVNSGMGALPQYPMCLPYSGKCCYVT